VQPLRKTVWRFLEKLKIELPYNPAIALLGIYPKTKERVIQKDTCTPMFIAALFCTIAKLWKQPNYPFIDECIKKMWSIYHIHTMEYYSAIKKNEILLFATMWIECITLSEISQSLKDKYCMIHLEIPGVVEFIDREQKGSCQGLE